MRTTAIRLLTLVLAALDPTAARLRARTRLKTNRQTAHPALLLLHLSRSPTNTTSNSSRTIAVATPNWPGKRSGADLSLAMTYGTCRASTSITFFTFHSNAPFGCEATAITGKGLRMGR
jgi:hypothetical protein